MNTPSEPHKPCMPFPHPSKLLPAGVEPPRCRLTPEAVRIRSSRWREARSGVSFSQTRAAGVRRGHTDIGGAVTVERLQNCHRDSYTEQAKPSSIGSRAVIVPMD